MQQQKQYFQTAGEEIAARNMNALKNLSIVTVGFLIFLLILAPLIIHGWKMSVYHAMFVPAAAIFCVGVWCASLRHISGIRYTSLICAAFWVMIFTFIILIDIFSNPNAPSCFMPVICIVLPASFIMPASVSFGLVGIFEVIYIIGLAVYKNPSIAQYDLFCSVCALGISTVVYFWIMTMRVRDYYNYIKYEQLSKHDTLITGLYNRQSAQLIINRYIKLHNPVKSCAFLVFDLDNFKNINDTYGHRMGDLALEHMGEVLLDVFGEQDVIARFGGDEFIVFKTQNADRQSVMKNCRSISNMLKGFQTSGKRVTIECSIGAVTAENQNIRDFDSLFGQADAAMYSVKNSGKGRCAVRSYIEKK